MAMAFLEGECHGNSVAAREAKGPLSEDQSWIVVVSMMDSDCMAVVVAAVVAVVADRLGQRAPCEEMG